MKPNLISRIAVLILLAGCSAEVAKSQQEEKEYQEFVLSINNNMLTNSQKTPKERAIAYDVAYKESGLQSFIYGAGDFVTAGDRTLDDLNEFYEKVVNQQYANRDEQEELRLKFIAYATTAFNLTNKEDPKATQHLKKYTKELMKNNRVLDAGMSYKCLSSIRGLIDKDEYNAMVKKSKFQVRFTIEQIEKTLGAFVDSDPKEPINRQKQLLDKYAQYLSDFDALVIK